MWYNIATWCPLLGPQNIFRFRVYSDWTRQRQFDRVTDNALDLEHLLLNRSIQTGRVASKILYNRDAVDLVWRVRSE